MIAIVFHKKKPKEEILRVYAVVSNIYIQRNQLCRRGSQTDKCAHTVTMQGMVLYIYVVILFI